MSACACPWVADLWVVDPRMSGWPFCAQGMVVGIWRRWYLLLDAGLLLLLLLAADARAAGRQEATHSRLCVQAVSTVS